MFKFVKFIIVKFVKFKIVKDVERLYERLRDTILVDWLVPMADIIVLTCLDDNQHRELILRKSPEYKVAY